jgi:hypothetical protein
MRDDRRGVNRRRVLAAAFSVFGHLSVVLALLWSRPETPKIVEQAPMIVELVEGSHPAAQAAPVTAAAPAPAKAPPPSPARPVFAQAAVDPLPVAKETAVASGTELTDAQIAGASSADSGGAGHACDMARWVQSALRKDPLVQAAVAGSAGKATLVWNGDWVRSDGEDGKGLAAVREAIIWEIAFAPEACRGQPVRGLVLMSLNAAAGAPRLAVGAGLWRWSDLLTPRAGVSDASVSGR